MPEVELDDVTIAYDVSGEGEPVVLVCGCGQPAIAWHSRPRSRADRRRLSGHHVRQPRDRAVVVAAGPVFDRRSGRRRGRPPRPSRARPRARRRALDGRMDRGDLGRATSRPRARRGAHGQLQRRDGVGEGDHHRRTRSRPPRRRAPAALLRLRDPALPAEPRSAERRDRRRLARDDRRPGTATAESGPARPVRGVPRVVARSRAHAGVARHHGALPRARVRARHRLTACHAREAAAQIPGARFAEIPDSSHLGIFTHADAVAAVLVDFFAAGLSDRSELQGTDAEPSHGRDACATPREDAVGTTKGGRSGPEQSANAEPRPRLTTGSGHRPPRRSGSARASASERRIGNHGSSLPQITRPRYVFVFMNRSRAGAGRLRGRAPSPPRRSAGPGLEGTRHRGNHGSSLPRSPDPGTPSCS